MKLHRRNIRHAAYLGDGGRRSCDADHFTDHVARRCWSNALHSNGRVGIALRHVCVGILPGSWICIHNADALTTRYGRRHHRPTVVFVTVCTKNRRSILASAKVHDALIETWSHATAWLVGRYVVMPDHMHLFAIPGPQPLPLGNWVAFWKSRLARKVGTGIWQEGYWDRTLRDGESYAEKWEYVRDNPVRKGLVGDAMDWPLAGSMNDLNW